MDWDLKVPTFDSAELEKDTKSVISSADITSSNVIVRHEKGSDCPVDLKLCQLGDFESLNKWKEQLGVPTPIVSPSGSLKTTRLRINGIQRVSCSVDGCKSDLSKCKEYHRRHKVCEAHSKTPVVSIGGKEQRFCQQCSRFHSLVKFDEAKRSCRKRLDGHNRRRRKPCPDLMNTGSLFTNLQRRKFLSYPHMFPNSVSGSEWTSMAKLEDNMLHRNHQPFQLLDGQKLVPGFHSYKNERQIPFSQDNLAQAVPEASSYSDTSKTIFFSGGHSHVLNSNRAFSLLSPQIHTPSIRIWDTPFSSGIPTAQPLIQSSPRFNNLRMCSHPQASDNVTATGFSSSQIVADQISTVIAPDAKDEGLNCHGFVNVGSVESSHASHFLPFSWS